MDSLARAPWWPLNPTEKLRTGFLDAVGRLTEADWLLVARRYESLEAKLETQGRALYELNSEYAMRAISAAATARERALAFAKWQLASQQSIVGLLAERVDGEGGPFLLRRWAAAAMHLALTALTISDESLSSADKPMLMALGLSPFAGIVPLPSLPDWSASQSEVGSEEETVGVESEGGSSSRALHLVFPSGYLDDHVGPVGPGQRRHHETWRLPVSSIPPADFGGLGEGVCAVCGDRLHRLITLPAIPSILVGEKELHLLSCLSCLGWSVPVLFFKHGGGGRTAPAAYCGPRKVPEFPARGLRPTTVRFAATPKRWECQPYGESDRQNVHRVGGFPSWIQDEEIVKCPDCGRSMRFILQLDSRLPDLNGGRWLWGSGGLLYVFWCGDCRIDAQMWQCT